MARIKASDPNFPTLLPTESLVYDNYLGYFLTVLRWAAAGREVPLEQLAKANDRIRLANVFLGADGTKVEISATELAAHRELFAMVADFQQRYEEWSNRTRTM